MKLTDTIDVSASSDTMSVTIDGLTTMVLSPDGLTMFLSPEEAITLAVSLAKWGTNPGNLAYCGGDAIREVAATLMTESDDRDERQADDNARLAKSDS